ncbi:MAG TPA: polysaccharide biosynthesis/export family protein [Candidatus Acidoferrales bacterium]|jgi:polysaccharide export outer membrane protein|nr:polysaccharide biosynthesis/export family protein [Candidatus Acidoferrales bacterium]
MSNNPSFIPFAMMQRLLMFSLLVTIGGCQTENLPDQSVPRPNSASTDSPAQPMVLREGDSLSVSIPSSPTLDTTQQIRTDGKIVLPLIGEVTASGKTPEDLQNELLKLYEPQVSAKQVIVTVQSPNIPVYVTGAVMRPGPIAANHPISALDAIMEAGGFDFTKANLRAVVVVRQEKDRTVRYKLNLKKVWEASEGAPFYLQPFDIVYVPERFTWY